MGMSYEFWFSTFVYAGTAGLTLFALISGLAPLSGREAIRREKPVSYWLELLIVPTLWALAGLLISYGDPRATAIIVAPVFLFSLGHGVSAVQEGRVLGSGKPVGSALLQLLLFAFWLGMLAILAWVLADIVRDPPWRGLVLS